MKTSEKIIEYIKKNKQATGVGLADFLDLTDRAVRKQLKSLLDKGVLEKVGKPPKVFYKISGKKKISKNVFDVVTKKVLKNNFYYINPTGRELVGENGFVEWCLERDFNIQKKAKEFVKIFKKYQKIRKSGLIDASHKLKKTFKKETQADKLYYYDFYSIEVFGKTKIGQKLLYAKQSQNKKLMKDLVGVIEPKLLTLIKREKIKAVAFVPPTVKREVQLMKILEKSLRLNLPKVNIVKVTSGIPVAQKTLKKLADRVENATESFMVKEGAPFSKVLLIDDAVGSGASINQIAAKLKERNIAKKVIGFAITGSLNDFDVISEV